MGDDIVRALDRYHGQEPPYPCWLNGGDKHALYDYCEACAEKASKEHGGDYIN